LESGNAERIIRNHSGPAIWPLATGRPGQTLPRQADFTPAGLIYFARAAVILGRPFEAAGNASEVSLAISPAAVHGAGFLGEQANSMGERAILFAARNKHIRPAPSRGT